MRSREDGLTPERATLRDAGCARFWTDSIREGPDEGIAVCPDMIVPERDGAN